VVPGGAFGLEEHPKTARLEIAHKNHSTTREQGRQKAAMDAADMEHWEHINSDVVGA
jgi:hypothetical protein